MATDDSKQTSSPDSKSPRVPLKTNGSEEHSYMSDIYEQSGLACAHYSTVLSEMRGLSVTQGFVVLATVGYLTDQEKYAYAMVSIFFGFFFVIAATFYRRNYLLHFKSMVEWTADMEKRMMQTEPSDDQATPSEPATPAYGPWGSYSHSRRLRYQESLWAAFKELIPAFLKKWVSSVKWFGGSVDEKREGSPKKPSKEENQGQAMREFLLAFVAIAFVWCICQCFFLSDNGFVAGLVVFMVLVFLVTCIFSARLPVWRLGVDYGPLALFGTSLVVLFVFNLQQSVSHGLFPENKPEQEHTIRLKFDESNVHLDKAIIENAAEQLSERLAEKLSKAIGASLVSERSGSTQALARESDSPPESP